MWIPRELDATLAEAAATRPAVVLTGCRQAGKTSLLVKSFPKHTYVSLDVPMVAEEAEHSGGEFLKKYPPPIIIDEVQYAPGLLRHVKADIDIHRDETGRFLITDSNRPALVLFGTALRLRSALPDGFHSSSPPGPSLAEPLTV